MNDSTLLESSSSEEDSSTPGQGKNSFSTEIRFCILCNCDFFCYIHVLLDVLSIAWDRFDLQPIIDGHDLWLFIAAWASIRAHAQNFMPCQGVIQKFSLGVGPLLMSA